MNYLFPLTVFALTACDVLDLHDDRDAEAESAYDESQSWPVNEEFNAFKVLDELKKAAGTD
ncbi:hypothetical protein DSO57_1019375 [Entomophthora muscae]|uniref:Uncharacterized protein n=1 Tax=Entomophthora muscae TaxID=34485 RepID=A0ACC2SST1_9FUNG|nr:hypothetical protein DSO57_1019375 [Entomophthora muscae]